MREGNGFKITPGSDPQILTTAPEHILRHNISNEELDMLTAARTDMSREIMLVAIGAAIGALPAAATGVSAYISAEIPTLPLAELIQLIVCVSGISLFVAMAVVRKDRVTSAKDLRNQIRERTLHSVDK